MEVLKKLNISKIDYVQINGIQSYYDKIELKELYDSKFIILNGQNLTNERGSNGTGKSTIFKQILYQLGISQRIPKTIISKGNNIDNGTMTVHIKDKDGKILKISRTIYTDNTKASTLSVSLDENEIKFQRNEYFREFLELEVLGCSLDIFKTLKVFTQDNLCILRDNNSEIIKMFEQIFKISELDNYYMKQNQQLSNYQSNLNKVNILIENEKLEIESIKKKLIGLDNKVLDGEQLNNISKLEREIQNIELLKPSEVKSIKDKENQLNVEMNKLNTEIYKLEMENVVYGKEITKFSKLQNSNVCPTCLRKTSGDQKFIEESKTYIDEKKKIINKNKEILLLKQNKQKELKLGISNIDKILQENKTQAIMYENKVKNLKNLHDMIGKQTEKNKTDLNKQIQERENKIIQYKDQSTLFDEKISIYDYLSKQFSQRSEIRQTILHDIIQNGLNNHIKTYSQFLFNDVNSNVDFRFNGNIFEIGITESGIFKEFQLLSQGEKKKVEIIFILQLNNLVQSFYDIKFNMFIFDEFLDNLDESSVMLVIELLNMYQNTNDQMIFITTHKNDIVLSDSSIIEIIKENEFSRLQNFTHI